MQIVLKKKLGYDTTRILSLNNINPLSYGLILGKMITVFSGVFIFHLGCLLPFLYSPLSCLCTLFTNDHRLSKERGGWHTLPSVLLLSFPRAFPYGKGVVGVKLLVILIFLLQAPEGYYRVPKTFFLPIKTEIT